MEEIPDISKALQVKSCGSCEAKGLSPTVLREESCSAHQPCSQLPCAGSLELEDDHPRCSSEKKQAAAESKEIQVHQAD